MIRHEMNRRGRDFFVGDLHGEYDLLSARLRGVDFDERVDRLFSVGDLIDRGPASLACLQLARQPWFHGVRGNHEVMAYEALCVDDAAMPLWRINGGGWALDESLDEVRRVLKEALHHLPFAREVRVGERRIGLVHAEPPADWARIEECDRHALVWGRERIRQGDTTPVTGIDAVVVGHTIVEAPRVLGNVHYLDTGAFLTGRLTLVEARDLLG